MGVSLVGNTGNTCFLDDARKMGSRGQGSVLREATRCPMGWLPKEL